MMWGSIPEWLTFAAVYIWAGIWFFDKINAADPHDMSDKAERLVPLICIIAWPVIAIITPFSKP